MATTIEVQVPTGDFALEETLATFPDVDLEIERVVAGDPEQITPYVWARANDFEALEVAFEADPTVERVIKVSESDEERSYQMEWTGPIEVIVRLLTNYQGTITHATGSNKGWKLRAMFPNRKSLSQACDAAQKHGFQYEVQALYEAKGSCPHQTGLTDKQRDTLVAAFEAGCFDVPRETTLTKFAEEQNISHQSMSERLRRATGRLVESTLITHHDVGDG
jgi:predicted DNA binding protein